METLFLKVLNMSITASYVIIAVLVIRAFMKRAPKKYSYMLWIVALFRLVCPVSFSSLFSIFNINVFDMTIAQEGSTALSYVPADIGTAEIPKVTVGIPTMNTIINDALPAAAPAATTPVADSNPLQFWIILGTTIWCVGVIILLIYIAVAFIRLKQRVSTAIRQNDNVFECDNIRSPFILGFVKPVIYIPFGLSERECAYILQHEAVHIRRKDYLLKAIGFLVLAIHWFNPLVWLAFRLMTKDMEMSCDEKVLTEAGIEIVREYTASLVSFASNRRFSAANPITFGEIEIHERVKNALRFKKPKKWVTILTMILCVIAITACAANPSRVIDSSNTVDPSNNNSLNDISDLYGYYVFEKQLYMNPLSSFIAFDGHKEYYTLAENQFIIIDKNGNELVYQVTYEQSEVDEQEFKNSFIIDDEYEYNRESIDITKYKERYRYELTGSLDGYWIYLLDDEIWLVKMHKDSANVRKNEYIWSIYKIVKGVHYENKKLSSSDIIYLHNAYTE